MAVNEMLPENERLPAASSGAQARATCKLAIARQLGIQHGFAWPQGGVNPLPSGDQLKAQERYMTYAENILATVERMQKRYTWGG